MGPYCGMLGCQVQTASHVVTDTNPRPAILGYAQMEGAWRLLAEKGCWFSDYRKVRTLEAYVVGFSWKRSSLSRFSGVFLSLRIHHSFQE